MLLARPPRAILARLASAAAAVLLASACTGGAAVEGAKGDRTGGTAVLGSISDVDTWNEYLSRQTFASNLQRRIFLRLAQERGDTADHPPTFEPLLAESWEFSDGGRTLTFRLREALWSDGQPVTSEDVRFTWIAQTSPEVGWIAVDSKRHVTDVEVVEPRVVRFRFDRVYSDQLSDAVEGGILPAHVFGRIPFERWRTYDWSRIRVGSGPFLLERYDPGQEILLRRNPLYFREGRPRLDAVAVRIVPDTGSLLTQLLAGAVDYLEGTPLELERAREDPQIRLVPFEYPMFDYIGWNGSRAPLDDPVVRRALTLGIDREALVAELLHGHGRVSAGPLLSYWWSADPTLVPWPYDPVEARRLLESRGFAPQPGDGILARDGRVLELELMTNAGNGQREAALVKIQGQLAKIGVRVVPRPLEMQTFRHLVESGDYDAYLGGWRFSGKIELRALFGSDSLPPRGANVVRYRSAEVDRLLTDLDAVSEWNAMKPILARIQRQLHEDQPYTFLYECQRLAAVGPALRGVRIDVPADPLARLEEYWVDR